MNEAQKKAAELKLKINDARVKSKSRQAILNKLSEKISLTSPQVQSFVESLPKHVTTSIYNRLDEEMLNFHKQEMTIKSINPFAIKI